MSQAPRNTKPTDNCYAECRSAQIASPLIELDGALPEPSFDSQPDYGAGCHEADAKSQDQHDT
jgi:hypothetical protein